MSFSVSTLVSGHALACLGLCITQAVCIPPLPVPENEFLVQVTLCTRIMPSKHGAACEHLGAAQASAWCLPPSFLARQEKAFPLWMATANGPGILNAAVCSGTGAARS